ncbi:MAG: PP2C family serine/threonine-protein phosphatase [Steroidobacterales bacterium]
MFSASATGKRNLEQGAAGQDASHCVVTDDVLVAVVCDGAGSVREGRAGSQFIAHELAEQLSGVLTAGSTTQDHSEQLDADIHGAVEAVRTRLAGLAESRQLELHDFSCTLLGCVAWPGGGAFFHIGDGFGIWQEAGAQSVLSQPENGEYADETYFVTDENWKQHLRLTPLPEARPGCVIGLMSDGTAPFAVNRARSGFFAPFIDPIADFLRKATAPNGNEALRNLLESPRASEISPDDKTLLLAFVL